MSRLPIKLPDGTVKPIGHRRIEQSDSESPSDDEDTDTLPRDAEPPRDDVATGARFGRMAVVDVLRIEPRQARIHAAKEQLASICQDIIADPENNVSIELINQTPICCALLISSLITTPQLGLLRRLHSFAQPSISSPSHPDPVTNDPLVRKYAILSQCAVFLDIIPGYRIRNLTDHEKSEKVTQAVMRQREFEQGLVGAYQKFLANMDEEIKGDHYHVSTGQSITKTCIQSGRTDLAGACLKAMCSMLLQATHFNFRSNLLATIVGQLGRKSWTPVGVDAALRLSN